MQALHKPADSYRHNIVILFDNAKFKKESSKAPAYLCVIPETESRDLIFGREGEEFKRFLSCVLTTVQGTQTVQERRPE